MNDEDLLSDYADGRMTAEARARFEERLRAEPSLERRARELAALKAALAQAAPPMPADLKAALKREARRAASRPPSFWEGLRAALSAPWAYGAGAAFAAAAALLLLRRPQPPQPAPGAAFQDAAAARGLERLWQADDGRDGDAT